jgi:LmbE family N-acetylglucosaminyl deacetylase
MLNKVLVISVHPDDETLGAGGTLLKHKSLGDKIFWLNITGIHEEQGFTKDDIYYRSTILDKVSKAYEFDDLIDLNLPTMALDKYSQKELVEKISNVIKTIKPSILYIPFKDDVHTDHQIVFKACWSASKSFRYPFIKRVLMMETISETDFAVPLQSSWFIPNVFIDITDYMDKKIEIIKIYEKELGIHPFPRNVDNIKALATYRGSMCNAKYAESFMLLKEIL